MTVDGITHMLPEPFQVMATQNPIEYEGTFPLPEAQLDRFLMRISLGYPTLEEEMSILGRQQHGHPVDELNQVVAAEEVISLQEAVRDVYVDDLVKEYIVQVVQATRRHSSVYLGASPRGSLALFRTGQARALLQGRDFVTPDDVKTLAGATLSHRLIVSPAARVRNVTSNLVVDEVLDTVAVPGARARGR